MIYLNLNTQLMFSKLYAKNLEERILQVDNFIDKSLAEYMTCEDEDEKEGLNKKLL